MTNALLVAFAQMSAPRNASNRFPLSKHNNMTTPNKHKIRNDIILIAATLIIAAIALVIYSLSKQGGNTAVVTVGGDIFGEYPLSEDRVVEIRSSSAAEPKNVLVIEDGKAYITEASCPDLICAHHAPISSVGESIICIPNKTVVSIE